jgi:hypothetical protein
MELVGVSLRRLLQLMAFAICCNLQAAPEHEARKYLEALPGADLFREDAVAKLQIEISVPGLEVLQKEPRQFVSATIRENQVVYTNVAIHLKGAIGSFRPVDDKPSLTVDFEHFSPGRKFHGLRRVHLNNSVEDPTYCNERLGSELFGAAGIPAPRVAGALVTLNGRRLGLYVLKEGFTEDFLSCHFSHPGGNLYEPEEGHDVNQHLKRNSVRAQARDRQALRALAMAALDPNISNRWAALNKSLATKEFISFMAMEIMIGHRDGYCLARNNFRVYEELDSQKIMFLPDGMDQLFGNPSAPWQPRMAGLVAKAVIEIPEGKLGYRECFTTLLTNLLRPDFLATRVDRVVASLRPFATVAEFDSIQNEAIALKRRIAERRRDLDLNVCQPELKLLSLENGDALLENWVKAEEPHDGTMEMGQSPDGISELHIMTRSEASTSWRTRAVLNRGHYRFEGRARVSGVKPLASGKHQGAALRIGGSTRRSDDLVGDSSWRVLGTDFQVETDATEVEFICELRAVGGEVWFDKATLKVVSMPQ